MKRAHYDELAFPWKAKTAEKVFQHKIQKDIIFNFDQFPLGFPCSEKNTESAGI